tara:strand:+ start:14 stop:370 length:357 start_codon:yes stop_codon:yes gene_type:complete
MSTAIEKRPWGTFQVLLDSKNCKVKQITVNPNQRLSYQYHHHREEFWTMVSGTGTVTLEGKDITVNQKEQIHIPLKAKHRISNKTNDPLIFIEIQMGTYFGEDDIIRLDDDYNRSSTD